jgi:hypothetical protein
MVRALDEHACGRALCPASPSRGGLSGLAGVTTRPAGYPSGGVPPAVERQLQLTTGHTHLATATVLRSAVAHQVLDLRLATGRRGR